MTGKLWLCSTTKELLSIQVIPCKCTPINRIWEQSVSAVHRTLCSSVGLWKYFWNTVSLLQIKVQIR